MNTEILVILDRSGSMASIRTDCNGGFDAFIRQQREVAGQARVTLAEFDNLYEVTYESRALADVPPLNLQPRGGTALLDAIGRTLEQQAKRIAKEKWAQLVVVVIITDGEENASTKFNHADIKRMINFAESTGWQFVFLAANQDAFDTGAAMGISTQNTANYKGNPLGTRSMYSATASAVGAMRSGGVRGQSLQAEYDSLLVDKLEADLKAKNELAKLDPADPLGVHQP